ncbi:MAG: hypothetical protein NT107_15935 [Planctomycetota bacterium]|nr:hypothetical protein [Planctomycetota bacterium]
MSANEKVPPVAAADSREALAAQILVTESDRTPLSGVAVSHVDRVAFGMISVPTTEMATTSATGIAVVRDFLAGTKVVLSKRGYCAETLTLRGPGEYHVALNRGNTLTVRCFCGSAPIRDCTVILSTGEVATCDFATTSSPRKAVGDSSSGAPIWVDKTDGAGVCTFDLGSELSPSRLSVFHDAFYPIEEVALGGKDITKSVNQVDVAMEEMYAVVCHLPDDQPVISHFWSYDPRGRSTQVGALARMRFCKKRLMERFPGSLVVTCRPADTGVDLRASVDILAKDGTEWSLTWAFVPISQLAHPAFPDLVATPGRAEVVPKLVVDGVEIKDERMRLVKQSEHGRALVFPVKSGCVIDVPAGMYNLEPQYPMAWGEESADALPTQVRENSREALVVSTKVHMARCEFEPRLLGDALDRAVQVSVVGDEASLSMAWRKEDGPIVVWLPAGKYSIVAYADGYGKVEREFTSPKDRQRCDSVTIELEKPSRSR